MHIYICASLDNCLQEAWFNIEPTCSFEAVSPSEPRFLFNRVRPLVCLGQVSLFGVIWFKFLMNFSNFDLFGHFF